MTVKEVQFEGHVVSNILKVSSIFSTLCYLVPYVFQEICQQLLELLLKWLSEYCKLIKVFVCHSMLNLRIKDDPIFDFGFSDVEISASEF
jgi:hypothetical protein